MEKNKKKITFVTFARSDFGIMKNIIEAATNQKKIEVSLFLSGTHFSNKFGKSINEIKEQKFFRNIDKIKYFKYAYSRSNKNLTNIYFSKIFNNFSEYLINKKPDKVVLIGDRYEMLAVALACFNLNINAIHFCGGSTTIGSLDNKYRDMISLISDKHFVETNMHKKKLIDLKIKKKNIIVVGAPALENVKKINFLSREKLLKKYNIELKKDEKLIISTFHPETNEFFYENLNNLKILISFLKQLNQTVIFTYPGADHGFNKFIKLLKKINSTKIFVFKNLGIQEYYQFLKNSDLIIGNSSSGIIETGYFKISTIDIGNRQKGRVRNCNVLNSPFNLKELRATYKKIMTNNFRSKVRTLNDKYRLRMTSSKIIQNIIK